MELKRFYERPEAELLVVRFERDFLGESNSDGLERFTIETEEEDF